MRRGRDQNLLGIDRPLRPEAAADVGDDDADFFDRQTERRGDDVPERVRALGRRRHDERAGGPVAICEDTAGLDRDGAEAGMAQTLPHDQVRAGHRALGVAHGAARHHGRVVGPALVQARARGQRGSSPRRGRRRAGRDSRPRPRRRARRRGGRRPARAPAGPRRVPSACRRRRSACSARSRRDPRRSTRAPHRAWRARPRWRPS